MRKSCANEAFVMCKLLCVVLTSESLDICLYVVLELTPQKSLNKNKVSEETEQKTAFHTTTGVVWPVVWRVGSSNEIQPEATEPTTAFHTSVTARMRGHMKL